MKRLVRQLVTSRVFKSASVAPASMIEIDPENLFLSYYTPRRLDAEAILDSIQFVSDRLDHGQPDLAANGDDGHRAIYRRVRRNFLDPFLTAFNYPIPTSTVGARNSTNVPAQSLMLMNGHIVRSAAQEWSQRIVRNEALKTDRARIKRLFLQAYSRQPTPEEMHACRTYLGSETDIENGYFRIAHAILNSKELIYVY